MNQIAINLKPILKGKKVLVELNADQFERLASNLGFYNLDFLKSLERSEKDFRAGRVYKLTSLSQWRKKSR